MLFLLMISMEILHLTGIVIIKIITFIKNLYILKLKYISFFIFNINILYFLHRFYYYQNF